MATEFRHTLQIHRSFPVYVSFSETSLRTKVLCTRTNTLERYGSQLTKPWQGKRCGMADSET